MPPEIYLVGLSLTALAIIIAVWVSAVTTKRSETRSQLERLNALGDDLSEDVYRAWVAQGNEKLDPRSAIVRIDVRLSRWKSAASRFDERTLKKRNISELEEALMNLATLDIEDKDEAPATEREKRYASFFREMDEIMDEFELVIDGWRYRLIWW